MKLADGCVRKIENLGNKESIRRGFRSLFEAITQEALAHHLPASTMVMLLYDEEDQLQSGEYAAELHFVVRKVE